MGRENGVPEHYLHVRKQACEMQYRAQRIDSNGTVIFSVLYFQASEMD